MATLDALAAAAKRACPADLRRWGLILGLVLCTCAEPADPLPDGFPAGALRNVCRPEIVTPLGKRRGGSAFVLRLPPALADRQLLVTAHHVLGSGEAASGTLPWNEVPRWVREVVCEGMADASIELRATSPLVIRGAASFTDGEGTPDLAALQLADLVPDPLVVATQAAVEGDVVWLMGRVLAGEPRSQLLHQATVVRVTESSMQLEYVNPQLDLMGTSGAPVVDRRGRVLGLAVGESLDSGRAVGIAQPVSLLLQRFTFALGTGGG